MKYVKIVINDTIIIDDIKETYICIYFPEYIKNFKNNNYIASTIYINRFKMKNLSDQFTTETDEFFYS